jgi:hypothetical protein
MKIEVGESLIYSWLRHVVKCQLVQINWKPSRFWQLHNRDELEALYKKSNSHFYSEYSYQVYKENKDLEQILEQAEIDVFGLANATSPIECYVVDIAFHIAGLNYGTRKESCERIIKKIIRSAMCLYGYFNLKSGEIIFASPKINPAILTDMSKPIDDINQIFKERDLDYRAKIVANQDFHSLILEPLLSISDDVADTNELFLRSNQLLKMHDVARLKEVTKHKEETKMVYIPHQPSPVDQYINCSHEEEGLYIEQKNRYQGNSPFKEYYFQGKRCTQREMEKKLTQTNYARRTVFYKDGTTKTSVWNTSNFNQRSMLSGNLHSGPLKRWKSEGIVGIRIDVD